jgi:hypothetical protein
MSIMETRYKKLRRSSFVVPMLLPLRYRLLEPRNKNKPRLEVRILELPIKLFLATKARHVEKIIETRQMLGQMKIK